ncbi:MAG: hypothetical protein QW703_01675 [Candidatus Aenigmatarchaeota archaeon]
MVKGQVEIIFILAIVIVAVVVIFYAFQSGLIGGPPAPPTEVEAVKLSVKQFIKEGLEQIMENVTKYGGYTERPYGGSVLFLNDLVPYWLASGQTRYPELKASIIASLSNWIKTYKAEFEEILINETGKNITLGEPLISDVKIGPNRIDVQVTMPTTVNDKPVPQPYEVSYDTKLGEIYEFAKRFVEWEKDSRFFEYATLSTIALSPVENGVKKVPLYVVPMECEFIFKSWYDIRPAAEEAIKATLAGIYMPGKAPTNTMTRSAYPKYSLVQLDGKDYSDIDVSFHLPDDFALSSMNFQFRPNPIVAFSRPGLFGMCIPDFVNVSYMVRYPVVVDVKDTITGRHFRFAVDVYIKDNLPAEWGAEGYVSEAQQEICETASCIASVNVKDEDGKAISDASLMFMGCPIGQTDSNGRWYGIAPCGAGWINVYRQGYEPYSEGLQSSELIEKNITLRKLKTINVHVYELNVQNLTASKQYAIYPTGLYRLGEGHENVGVLLALAPIGRINYLQNMYYIKSFTSQIKATSGNWDVWINTQEGGLLKGGVGWNINIPKDAQELWIYAPYSMIWPQNASEHSSAALMISKLYEKCGISPVATTPQDIKACTVSWDEVKVV